MQWLPDDNLKVDVLMPDKTVKAGLGEATLRDIEPGTMVQLERFGFCRLDKKEDNKITFWFTHK